MKDKILATELSMYYEEDDIFEETFSDKLYSIAAHISGAIKKMIVEMKAFAKEIESSIYSAELTIQLRKYISKVKKELAAGHDVYIPDITKITKVYSSSIDKLRKRVDDIGSELNKIIGSDSHHINKYNNNKDELSNDIDKMIDEVNAAVASSKIKVSPNMSNGMDKTIVNTIQGYISIYVKLIDDLEKLAIRFERNTARAEINHDIKVATRERISVLANIKRGSTKLARKSVFAICAITGI